MKLKCPKTGKLETQETVRETEDGITLKCCGCGKVHSHEIGALAEFFHDEVPVFPGILGVISEEEVSAEGEARK